MTKEELDKAFKENFPGMIKLIKKTYQKDSSSLRVHLTTGKNFIFVIDNNGIGLHQN